MKIVVFHENVKVLKTFFGLNYIFLVNYLN